MAIPLWYITVPIHVGRFLGEYIHDYVDPGYDPVFDVISDNSELLNQGIESGYVSTYQAMRDNPVAVATGMVSVATKMHPLLAALGWFHLAYQGVRGIERRFPGTLDQLHRDFTDWSLYYSGHTEWDDYYDSSHWEYMHERSRRMKGLVPGVRPSDFV